jgi:hypothetical protein
MNYAWGGGINSSGDFDQLSLAGVDFGEDYCENYGITPTTLQGDTMYSGHLDQMGMDYHQMGVVPEGLGADFDQMGIVPSGMGGHLNQMGHGYYNQMGVIPSGLGAIPSGLGNVMDQYNALSPTHKMIAGGVVAIAAYVGAQKFLGFKGLGLPFIG